MCSRPVSTWQVFNEFTGKSFEYGPAALVDQWRSPVYLAAGDDDRNVDFNQAVMLAQALRSRRPDVELVEHVVPNETHDLYLTFEDLVGVYQAGSDFLLRHLQHGSGASDRRRALATRPMAGVSER